ncbi:hypothetical protein GW17_00047306 [Ensete ventricosum]|nr:hypothetical protein GW17_00047306 [Ensete ventricosum]
MKEKPQSAARTFHAPPQILDIDDFIKHQPITILTDNRSSNDLMNYKRIQVTLCGKGENEEKMISTQCLETLVEISSTSAEPSRLLPTVLHDPHMLVLQGEPPAHIRPYYSPHFQRTEAKKIVQGKREIRIIRPQPSLAMTLYLQKLYLFVCRDKLFLKCHIQLNQLWVLMQCFLISVYFHDFTEEQTMMLKVFPNDDLGSTAHDRKKEQGKGIHMTPTTMMPSISMLALPKRGNVFVLRADTSRSQSSRHLFPLTQLRGEVKARQPYTLMVVILFARIQEERLNHKARRTRVTPRLAMPSPTTPSTTIRAPAPKKLTGDELHERSAKGLCWHCNEPWSYEHRCKKGQLLMIEPVEDEYGKPSKEGLEIEEEAM